MRESGSFPNSVGGNYASRAWRSSATLRYLATLPHDTLILTNAPDPVWFYTKRRAVLLPLPFNPYARRCNERYSRQMEDVATVTAGGPSILVYFDYPTSRSRRTIRDDVISRLGLEPEQRFADAIVYRVGIPDTQGMRQGPALPDAGTTAPGKNPCVP